MRSRALASVGVPFLSRLNVVAVGRVRSRERVHPREGREHDGAACGAWAGPISFDAEITGSFADHAPRPTLSLNELGAISVSVRLTAEYWAELIAPKVSYKLVVSFWPW